MERYNEYKDSGIYFIPDIPKSWQVLKAKYLFKQEKREVRPEDEIVTCFRDGQVTLRKNRRTEGFTNSMKEIGYQGVRKGDLVIHNMDAFAGAIGVSDSDGKGTPVYACCTPKRDDINQYYYCYLLRYLARNGFILSLAKGIRERSTDFRFNDFKELYLPVPSREEQDAIVSYIDLHSTKIDEAIAQQQKMIDLLNERKQIIINNAVTKGLNPNVKMKDSGVDWIGEIPEGWEVNRLKALTTNMRNGYVGPTRNLYQDAGVPYIQSLHVKNGTIDFNKKEYYVSPQWANKHPKIYKDDLVIVQTGDIGNTAIITEEFNGCNCHALIIVKVNKEIVIPEYLCFYLRSKVGKELMLQTKTGALLPHLNTTEIGTTIVIVPTIEEQRDIVNYLKEEIQKVESLIKIFEKQIFLLQERKQIIINEVVTGKVKVC